MYNETNAKASLVGTSTPKVASVVENEMQGLFAQTDNLQNIVGALFARLTPLLQSPKLKEVTEKDQIELTPLAQQIRINKQKIAFNVEALQDLLDRMDL